MEIEFEGRVTEEDASRVWLYNMKSSLFMRIITALVIFTLVLGVVNFTTTPDQFEATLLRPILLVVGYLGFLVFLRYLFVGQWRNYEVLSGPISGVFSSESIGMIGTKYNCNYTWKYYEKYKVIPNTILLYLTSSAVYIIPKSLFKDDADWEAVINLIKQNIPEK